MCTACWIAAGESRFARLGVLDVERYVTGRQLGDAVAVEALGRPELEPQGAAFGLQDRATRPQRVPLRDVGPVAERREVPQIPVSSAGVAALRMRALISSNNAV